MRQTRFRVHRPSAAMIVALLALFVALGGSGYAAVQLSKDSVLSKHIKNGQVKSADIASNAVTSAKVRNGSLLSKDFKAGQLVAGATGPPGPKGEKGDTGTVDTSNFYDKAAADARFRLSSDGVSVSYVNVANCGVATLVSYPVTVATTSRVFAFGSVGAFVDESGGHHTTVRVQLLSGATIVAESNVSQNMLPSNSVSAEPSGLLLSSGSPYEAAPGTYTLRLWGGNSGTCAGYVQYQGIRLSHLLVPSP